MPGARCSAISTTFATQPKAGKTGDSTASTYQRLAKSRLDLSSKDGGRLMVGVSARSWHTTRAGVIAVKAVVPIKETRQRPPKPTKAQKPSLIRQAMSREDSGPSPS